MPASAYASYAASTIMSCGSLSQFSPNLQQPMPTMATLSRMASTLPMTRRSYDPRPGSASLRGSERRERGVHVIAVALHVRMHAGRAAAGDGLRDRLVGLRERLQGL